MGASQPPAGDGPWHTREQAAARYAGFAAAAERGTSGAPGEQIVYEPGQLERETITDTLDTLIAPADVLSGPLGEYDLAVVGKIAEALDPVDVAVLCSMICRAAHDTPDAPAP
jgi:hypothetical protein